MPRQPGKQAVKKKKNSAANMDYTDGSCRKERKEAGSHATHCGSGIFRAPLEERGQYHGATIPCELRLTPSGR